MTLQEVPGSPKRWGSGHPDRAVWNERLNRRRWPDRLPKSTHRRETGSSLAFTEKEDRYILEERVKDAPYRTIARALGRTYSGVRDRHYRLLAGRADQVPPAAYSIADDELIRAWHNRGESYAAIGRELGKNANAVRRHIMVLKRQPTTPARAWLVVRPAVKKANAGPFRVADFRPSSRATDWQSQTVTEWMDWLASATQEQRAALVAYGRDVLAEQPAVPAVPLWPVAQRTMYAHEPTEWVKASARARQ